MERWTQHSSIHIGFTTILEAINHYFFLLQMRKLRSETRGDIKLFTCQMGNQNLDLIFLTLNPSLFPHFMLPRYKTSDYEMWTFQVMILKQTRCGFSLNKPVIILYYFIFLQQRHFLHFEMSLNRFSRSLPQNYKIKCYYDFQNLFPFIVLPLLRI
jgi:hypothetical protein